MCNVLITSSFCEEDQEKEEISNAHPMSFVELYGLFGIS